MQHHFTATHHPDARDAAGPRRLAAVSHVGGQRRELQKWCARIKQPFEALAWQELALLGQALDIACWPHVTGGILLGVERRHPRFAGEIIAPKFCAAGIE